MEMQSKWGRLPEIPAKRMAGVLMLRIDRSVLMGVDKMWMRRSGEEILGPAEECGLKLTRALGLFLSRDAQRPSSQLTNAC